MATPSLVLRTPPESFRDELTSPDSLRDDVITPTPLIDDVVTPMRDGQPAYLDTTVTGEAIDQDLFELSLMTDNILTSTPRDDKVFSMTSPTSGKKRSLVVENMVSRTNVYCLQDLRTSRCFVFAQ